MTAQEGQPVIDKYFPIFLSLFGLEKWTIRVEDKFLPGDTLGEVHMDSNYCDATIILHIEGHQTTNELFHTLRHEMIHLFLSAFHKYREQMKETMQPNLAVSPPLEGMFNTVSNSHFEDLVRAVENMFDFTLRLHPLQDLSFLPMPLATKEEKAEQEFFEGALLDCSCGGDCQCGELTD